MGDGSRHLTWVVGVAALAVCGCSDDGSAAGDGGGDDCRTLGCPSAFLCENPSMDGSYHCSSTSLGIPECRGTPPSSPLTTIVASGDVTVHQIDLGTCVPVTLSSDLASLSGRLDAAIASVGSVMCAQLCFTAPGIADASPVPALAERRIHFRAAESGELAAATYVLPTTWYEQDTGRILGCDVAVDLASLDQLNAGDVLASLLLCSGFSMEAPPAGSVLFPGSAGSRPETLSADDEAGLCALYGTPSYCASDDALFP